MPLFIASVRVEAARSRVYFRRSTLDRESGARGCCDGLKQRRALGEDGVDVC